MKRSQRILQASSPQERAYFGPGCILSAALLAAGGAALLAYRQSFGVVLVVPLLFVGWGLAYQTALLIAAKRRGLRAILVTSESPLWASHIAAHWLPRLSSDIVVLNYSRRFQAETSTRLGWALHRCFAGDRNEFCPVVIVFRGLRYPTIFRFYSAFKLLRSGTAQWQ